LLDTARGEKPLQKALGGCSHLAMRGAPAKAVQELAGHADLSTTMRYMHLSPASLNQAIRLLEQRGPLGGNSGATKAEEKQN
jgi:integrase